MQFEIPYCNCIPLFTVLDGPVVESKPVYLQDIDRDHLGILAELNTSFRVTVS